MYIHEKSVYIIYMRGVILLLDIVGYKTVSGQNTTYQDQSDNQWCSLRQQSFPIQFWLCQKAKLFPVTSNSCQLEVEWVPELPLFCLSSLFEVKMHFLHQSPVWKGSITDPLSITRWWYLQFSGHNRHSDLVLNAWSGCLLTHRNCLLYYHV